MENLAQMIQRGFEEVAKKTDVEGVEKRLAEFQYETTENFAYVSTRLKAIEKNTAEIVHRDEFDDLMARVKHVETRLGIKSGK